jgi:hypothetical protein
VLPGKVILEAGVAVIQAIGQVMAAQDYQARLPVRVLLEVVVAEAETTQEYGVGEVRVAAQMAERAETFSHKGLLQIPVAAQAAQVIVQTDSRVQAVPEL